MKKNEILLSAGSIIWLGLKNCITYAKNVGYDGLEIVPSRMIVSEIKNIIKNPDKYSLSKHLNNINFIKSIHQSWRLDIGLDKFYNIKLPTSMLFTTSRLILFPKIKESSEAIKYLSDNLYLPMTVHDLSEKWTKDNLNKELSKEILYEILDKSMSPNKLKNWMKKANHNVVIDSRDDQSLMWAKRYGFKTWKIFWKWLDIEKIKSYQLTLIGMKGLSRIMRHQKSLPEEQLLWLFNKKWRGNIVVEVNPLIIFFLFKGNMKRGLKLINEFARQTLIEGKNWSI